LRTQTAIKEFFDTTDTAMAKNLEHKIALTWIPRHSETEGNEKANAEAKKAALDPTKKRPSHHKPLRSARAQCIKAAVKAQWLKGWRNNTKTSHDLQCIIQRPGINKSRIKAVWHNSKQRFSGCDYTTLNRTLWIKPLLALVQS